MYKIYSFLIFIIINFIFVFLNEKVLDIVYHKKLSFEKIYSIYYPKLVRFSNEYILSIHDAENIVQDCFVHIWEQKDHLNTIKNINAYLFRLVKNKCVDYLRHKITVESKKRALQDTYIKEFEYKLLSIELFDDSSMSDEEIECIIHKAINNLPEKCREIFVLSKMNGMKYEEIAALLKISKNTVRNHVAAALKKMRHELKNYFPLFLFIIA
jgi:RNA polymerase sigma-70 factor (ECF subfamily)